MTKTKWIIVLAVIVLIVAWLFLMNTGAYAQDNEATCWQYEKAGGYWIARPCTDENPQALVVTPKEEPLLRRILINHLSLFAGYENRGELGYKRGMWFGIVHELDYRGILYLDNMLSFSPSGKVQAGGYFLQWEPRLRVRYQDWLFGGGLNLGYTDTPYWDKVNLMFAGGIGYVLDYQKYDAKIIIEWVQGHYYDMLKSQQYGIEMTCIADLPYNLYLFSRVGMYYVSSPLCSCSSGAVTGQLALGVKL